MYTPHGSLASFERSCRPDTSVGYVCQYARRWILQSCLLLVVVTLESNQPSAGRAIRYPTVNHCESYSILVLHGYDGRIHREGQTERWLLESSPPERDSSKDGVARQASSRTGLCRSSTDACTRAGSLRPRDSHDVLAQYAYMTQSIQSALSCDSGLSGGVPLHFAISAAVVS